MPEQNWKTPGYDPSQNGWWKASLGEEVSNFGYPHTYLFSDSARALVQAFGKHFSNIWVCHFDENGFPRKQIHVPIKFGPRSKAYDFRKAQEMKQKTGRDYYIPVPNITFKITGGTYDSSRAASMGGVRYFYDTYLTSKGVETSQLDLLWQDTMPVPQNISIEMTANCETYSDAMQIWEQVTGQFAPDVNLRIKEFWFIDIPRDLKLTMESYSFNFPDEFDEQSKRDLSVTFQFKLEAVIYTGIQDGTIIDQIRLTLDPSLAKTSSKKDLYYVFSGDKLGNIYVPGTEGAQLNVASNISAVALEPYGNCYRVKPEMWVNSNVVSSMVPVYDSPLAERMESASDYYIEYRFTSGYYDNIDEPYKSYFNISGNYKPEPGTYNSATHDWRGSLTNRYPMNKLQPGQVSADKDFYDGREVVRGHAVYESYNNEGRN